MRICGLAAAIVCVCGAFVGGHFVGRRSAQEQVQQVEWAGNWIGRLHAKTEQEAAIKKSMLRGNAITKWRDKIRIYNEQVKPKEEWWVYVASVVVQNNTGRTIDVLEITAYFQDENQVAIAEGSEWKCDILKPNYIAEFDFGAYGVPDETKGARFAVTGIRFAEDG